MLWVGWFGFNAGSALAADGVAGMAMLVTQIATATAAVTWMLVEWMKHGKPSVLGIVTGAVAGLVAITPASGSVGPMGAIALGAASGVFCFWGATMLKQKLGYDDSLDVWGVHGVAGIWGAIATGIWVVGDYAHGSQVLIQCKAVAYTLVYSGVVSFIILKVLDLTLGIRADEQAERVGLDLSDHAEAAYTIVD